MDATTGNSEVLVKWLGFEDDFNSWEPMEEIAKTHASLLRSYFQDKKLPIPEMLQDKTIREVTLIKNPGFRKSWNMDEKAMLRSLIIKFGFGCWFQLRKYLVEKSYQQIYDHLQRYLFFMDFSLCNGLRIDIEVLHEYLKTKLKESNAPSEFIRNDNKMVRRTTSAHSIFATLTRSSLSQFCIEADHEIIPIPVKSKRSMEMKCFTDKRFYCFKQALVKAFQKLVDNNIIHKFRESRVTLNHTGFEGKEICLRHQVSLQELHSFIKGAHFIYRVRKRPQVDFSQSQLYFKQLLSTDECFTIVFELDEPPTFFGNETPYLKGILFREVVNNVFQLTEDASRSSILSVSPTKSIPLEMEITPETFAELRVKYGKWDVIISDPPWKVGGGHPVPELNFSLKYRVEDFAELMKVKYDEALLNGGLLCIWVVNAHIHKLLWHMKNHGMMFQRVITWIKSGKDGNLIHSLGHYLTHSTETCLLFTRGKPNKYSLHLLHHLPETIVQPRTVASAKPQHLHRMIIAATKEPEKVGKRLLDVYGRVNNLEPYWITAGLQAKNFSLL